jgi:hypothetical protein
MQVVCPLLENCKTRAGAFLLASIWLVGNAIAQAPFPVVTTVDANDIAGRAVAVDAAGKLLPWPFPDSIGDSYSSDFLAQWTVLQDQFERQRLPYFYCCFAIDPKSYELIPDRNWANSTAYLRAMLEGFVEHLYPYTGDRQTLASLEKFVDYEMENGLTPRGYRWAGVPYPSANPGAPRYSGWSNHGDDYVEPHEIGEDGYAYVRLYEMTGRKKYLRAAIHFADELAKNYQPGDALHSPWPVRCFARDGRVEGKGMGPYSANVLGPISLFDELIRLNQGHDSLYAKTRKGAWEWLKAYPLQNNVWVGYFEDVPPTMGNMNNVIPLELARYVMLHPERDEEWRQHAKQLIAWVKTTPRWPKYVVHGATVTTEQGDGINFCCNQPNQCCDSHTARLAAAEALYFERTGDESYREEAFRSFNWVTYFQGLPGEAHAPFSDQWWFTDEFTDGPRRLMDGLWAVPEWAPAGESHLLGSSSVVTSIVYGRGSVRYSTFDSDAVEALRLDFNATSITAGGRSLTPLPSPPGGQPGSAQGTVPAGEGFLFDPATGVLRIWHRKSGTIAIQGVGGSAPARIVTFDHPHREAGTLLRGMYPAGVARWLGDSWAIAAPGGKFGTFSLAGDFTGAEHSARFEFSKPRVFAGIDAFNPGPTEITLRVRCGESPAVTVALRPHGVMRIKTGWEARCTDAVFEVSGESALRFDNLTYRP